MSNKTENIKNYINDIGDKNQLFLFVGNSVTSSSSNSSTINIDTWKDSDFSVKIGKDNIIGVVKNNKWTKKKAYTPWNSSIENIDNFYVYNENNGYVYLCISDNNENIISTDNQNISNNIPSHVSGDQTYEDGYTWKALYRITPSLERFVTDQWIPVISFDTFDHDESNTELNIIQDYCDPSNTSTSGYCALYFKNNVKYYSSSGVLTSGEKGKQYKIIQNLTCSECYNLFKNNSLYESAFSISTPTSTLEIKDKYDIIGDMVANNELSPASPYYYLYQANAQSPDEGYIVSAFIDLNQFNLIDLRITKDNPELTITSNTGSGAAMRLKTYRGIDDSIYVYGLEIISKGSGYRDISVSLQSAAMIGSITNSQLTSAITINLDEVDGLGFDPIKTLNAKHIMFDIKLLKQSLELADVAVPTEINFYSLVQNPQYITDNFEYTAGSTENKYSTSLYRTTTFVTVALNGNPPPSKTPSGVVIEKTDGLSISDIEIPTTPQNGAIGLVGTTTSNVELKHLEYSEISNLVGSNLIVE